MNISRCAAVLVLLALTSACGPSGLTSPSSPAASSSAAPPSTNFPPLSGRSRTFVFDHWLSSSKDDYTSKSQFVLYDDGGFVLQYLGSGAEYRGGYTVGNGGVVAFAWEGWSIAGPWAATGTLNGNSLNVQYNGIMQLTDFTDAAYVLAP